jgi:nucleotide-binding universal stress UspA family protein
VKPVLLATDGSPTAEAATTEAIELSRRLGAPLVVVTAWELPYAGLGHAPFPLSANYLEECAEAAEKIIDATVERAREKGVTATGLAVHGYPVDEVCRTAAKTDPQVLVLGAHGWGPIRRALHGSVSTGVLHHARCPVLVVPVDRLSRESRRIGATADPAR